MSSQLWDLLDNNFRLERRQLPLPDQKDALSLLPLLRPQILWSSSFSGCGFLLPLFFTSFDLVSFLLLLLFLSSLDVFLQRQSCRSSLSGSLLQPRRTLRSGRRTRRTLTRTKQDGFDCSLQGLPRRWS